MRKAYWVDWEKLIFRPAETLDRNKVEEILNEMGASEETVDAICDVVVDNEIRIANDEILQENKSLKVYKATAEERIKELEQTNDKNADVMTKDNEAVWKERNILQAKLKVAVDALNKCLDCELLCNICKHVAQQALDKINEPSVDKQPAKIEPLELDWIDQDGDIEDIQDKINTIIAHINKEA